MSALEQFISPALTRALGWTLLHSLWQGALVAAVLAGALLLLRRQRAEVRYGLAVGALAVIVALAGSTFELYFRADAGTAAGLGRNAERSAERPHSGSATATRAAVASTASGRNFAPRDAATAAPAPPDWLATGLRYFDQHLPLLVVAWGLGLLAISLRLVGGLLYVQRLRRYRVRPLGAAWQARLAALAGRCGIRQPVALLESALVRVPLVVGHVRPVILLPLGAVAGLPPTYLEAILAHELAHVLRRDYLVNLLQTVAEALFFYHPAVWFVGRCVRTERENCCDDQATALCGGDALRLARALTALAEWCQNNAGATAPRLALAAIGGRGALLGRVRRLVQRRPAASTLAEGLLAGALVLGGLGLLGGSVVLAGTSSPHPLLAGQPVTADWQTEPAPRSPKAGEVADTIRVRPRPASAAARPPGPVVPVPPVGAAFPPDAPDPAQLRRIQRNALRQAERALREANALKGLSPAQHQRITKDLADVQAQLRAAEQGFTAARRPRADEGAGNHPDDEKLRRREEQMRDREEERRDHEEEMRDREEDRHNHEEEMRDREENRRDHEEALHDREKNRPEHAAGMRGRPEAQPHAAADALVAELLKDGLIKDRNNFQLRLTARNLEVDGREQPPKVFRKYLKLHETNLGHPLSATGSLEMNHRSVSFRNEQGMPPPRPPHLPKLPPPPPPALPEPTPPSPPQAPAGPQ